MKLPIFVIEASDVQVCETIAQAEVAVEPYDVDDPGHEDLVAAVPRLLHA